MKLIRTNIGMDLTSKLAHLETGMGNALSNFLRSFGYNSGSYHMSLFVTEANFSKYRHHSCDNISLIVTNGSINDKYFSDISALHSPFNEITTKQGDVPNIVTVHDLIPEHFPEQFSSESRDKLKAICHQADFIFTISEFAKLDISSRYGLELSRIANISISFDLTKYINPIDCSKIRAKYNIQEPYLLYPAAARTHKNHDRLFDAFERVHAGVQLVLTTGEKHGSERIEVLKRKVEENGLEGRVSVLGFLPEEEYIGLLQSAHALVFPSLGEGFGIPVIEAMAAGCPVACSDRMSLPEVVGKAGLFFDPTSPDDIASKLTKICEDTDLRKSLIALGLMNAKRFDVTQNSLPLEGYRAAFKYFAENKQTKKRYEIAKPFPEYRNVRTLLKSANFLFSQGYYDEAILTYEKIRIAYQGFYPNTFIDTIEFNIGLSKHFRRNNRSSPNGTRNFLVLMDCTRLFTKNPFSGISRYCAMMLQLLTENSHIILIPFYNPKQRGFHPEATEFRTYTYEVNGAVYDILHYSDAIKIALKIDKPRIYHSLFHPLPAERLPFFKYCLTIFDLFHLTHPNFYPNGTKYVTRDIINSIETSCDQILTISEYTGFELNNFLDRPTSVTYMPLSTYMEESLFSGYQNERMNILIPFQGDPRKGFDRMIRIGLRWLSLDITSNLIVFGKVGKISTDIIELVNGEFYNRIDFIETPSDEELEKLFHKSFCFLYLSSLEGFGMPPLEACQFGCPPVIFSTTALQEIFRGWEFILPESSTDDEIISCVMKLKQISRRRIANMCLKMSQRYSWKLTAATTIAAYLAALGQLDS